MEKQINLEEILTEIFEPSPQDCSTPRKDLELAIVLNPSLDYVREAMKEAVRQAIELVTEEIRIIEHIPTVEDDRQYLEINKQSILDIINRVK